MSEQTTSVVEENVPSIEEFEDEYGAVARTLKKVTDDANADAKKKKELTSADSEQIDSLLNTSDDEEIAKWREWRTEHAKKIEEAEKKIAAAKETLKEADAKAKAKAKSLVKGSVSEDDLKALQESYLLKRKKATALKTSLLVMAGDEEIVKRILQAYGIVDVISSASGATTSNAGEIVRKRLASSTVNGNPVADKNGKTSFTYLSQQTGVDGNDIRDAMAKAANVESVKDIDSGVTVDFTITHNDETLNFSVTTK